MIGMVCKCGHEGPLDEFISAPVFGELPMGVFQCPRCHKALKKSVDRVWVDEETGQVLHSTKVEKVQAYL